MTTDIEYSVDGFWVRLMPCSKHGESVARQMLDQQQQAGITPSLSVLISHWPAVRSDIRAAGYSVRKARKPAKGTKKVIDDLYAELAELEA